MPGYDEHSGEVARRVVLSLVCDPAQICRLRTHPGLPTDPLAYRICVTVADFDQFTSVLLIGTTATPMITKTFTRALSLT